MPPLSAGEVLEGLAEALYLEREYAASATHYERAYAAYRRERQSMAAGRAARMVAWITGNVFGEWAVQSGWLARARTILEEAGEDGPERGWVLIIGASSEPDAQAREALYRDALAIGRRFGDPDVEFDALAYLGGLFVMTDRVEEGLVLLDEALTAICAGELRELATGSCARRRAGASRSAQDPRRPHPASARRPAREPGRRRSRRTPARSCPRRAAPRPGSPVPGLRRRAARTDVPGGPGGSAGEGPRACGPWRRPLRTGTPPCRPWPVEVDAASACRTSGGFGRYRHKCVDVA
jgi:hypothetical protein